MALVTAYFASLFVSEAGYDLVRDGVVVNVAFGLSAVLCLLRAVLIGAKRLAFAMLGLGCVLFTAGNVAYVAYVQYLDPFPFPNVADVGFLGAYPFFVVGVLSLGRSEFGGKDVGVWLDGLVSVLGVAAVGSALVLHTTLENISGDPFALLVGAAYPLADLLLISMIVGVLTVSGQRPTRLWALLALGLSIFAIADTVYLVRLSTDSYVLGTFLDGLWLVGFAVLAMSAWQPTRPSETTPRSGAGSLVVTLVFSLLAIAVLVASGTVAMPRYAIALATATMIAGLLRAVVVFHQLRHLAEVRHQAGTDDLTGLSNRRAFTTFLEQTLATTPADSGFAVLLIDLDRFKDVNDLFGHQMGDRLLCEIAPRLSPVLRRGDMLSRLGGDEFGLVLPDAGKEVAIQIARRVCDTLIAPFIIDDVIHQIAGSVGIALWPADSDNAHGLFQCADVAMYAAKSNRTGVEVYDPEHGADGRNRLAMAKDLHHAAQAGEFVLHYQPKLDLGTGQIVGVEALVRWQHPQRGLLYPDTFLAIAEQTGSIRALTTSVLSTAIAQCRQWRLDGLDLTMAVNLSASNLLDDTLVTDIAVMLTTCSVPPDALQVEITETTIVLDPQKATATLEAIHALGVTISIDDYGTGFSSLTYLRDFPIQELKIDRTFITHLTPHSRDAAIVKSIIELSHALGLHVVAEGVEDGGVITLLRDYGCDLAQGYYLCTPKAATELTAWLRTQPVRVLGSPIDMNATLI